MGDGMGNFLAEAVFGCPFLIVHFVVFTPLFHTQ